MLMRISILFGCLAVSASATPTFTNTGSASITCLWVGGVPPPQGISSKSYSATGNNINLNCPPSDPNYIGPAISGSAGDLSVSVGQGGAYHGESSFDFHSRGSDTVTVPGSGPATVVFTLNLIWGAGNDITAGETAKADLWFNGVEVWQDAKLGLNFELPPLQEKTIVLSEPIELGVPFGYQADVDVSGGGNGAGYGDSSLVVTFVAAPEPNALWLVAIGLAGLAYYSRREVRA